MKTKTTLHVLSSLISAVATFVVAATALGNCPPEWTTPPPPCEECPCPPGSGGGGPPGTGGPMPSGGPSSCPTCNTGGNLAEIGMPFWKVHENQVEYSLFDTPLHYKPAYGPELSLNLAYQTERPTDFGYFPSTDDNPIFGAQWHSLWNSELVIDEYVGWGNRTYWNYLGGPGRF